MARERGTSAADFVLNDDEESAPFVQAGAAGIVEAPGLGHYHQGVTQLAFMSAGDVPQFACAPDRPTRPRRRA